MTSTSISELESELRTYIGRRVGPPSTARDPVNQPMIRHWCDAMGDDNPVYTDPDYAAASRHGGIVAPPTMLQAWNMQGLRRDPGATPAQTELMSLLDGAGYTSVVATNCEQEYVRYLRPGDVLTEDSVVEDISPLKRTALGEGYFVTTRRTYTDGDGQVVATMLFRLLKFRPAARAEAAADTPAVPWPHPAINPDTAFFWEGTMARELRIQRCSSCRTLRHPPSPACGRCGSLEWDYVVSAGRGRVYSYVVHHHPPVPPHTTPFVVALVEMEEGTRIVGNLLGVSPDSVHVGQPVRLRFETVADDLVLPQWEPAGDGTEDGTGERTT
ncbi:MAG TPA: OB-fold domain-containing protein [Acidimicrobiales bacterium]|nr:OB-fold domain-containing protein [Acidimicrobiales bacterium]